MLKAQNKLKIKKTGHEGKKTSLENRNYSLSVAFCQACEGLNLARPAAVVPEESLSAQRTSLK